MIELKGLYKSYGKHIALNNIDLTIHQGEIFGIMGKSGAGKSTLLRCINRLEKPDAGEVLVDKTDMAQVAGKALQNARHKIGMIFQHFNLLNSQTVYENIALPMRIQKYSEEEIKQKINDLLHLVELENKASDYPNNLSGGQKQRVAIARALSTSPDILLCDEATSALDPTTTDSILNLLKKINESFGLTIVLITHEMEVIKQICHRLALMAQGEIIEQSNLADVFHNKKSIARKILYAQLSPELPECLKNQLSKTPNNHPLVKIYFEGQGATIPFISQTSRALNLDINILLANVDRIEKMTCGVLMAELSASEHLLEQFIKRCETNDLSVEILGYVIENGF